MIRVATNPRREGWSKFLHPYPLSARDFLVACRPDAKSSWGIYLADAFDNLVLIREEPGYALLELVPIAKRARPPVPVDRVDLERKDGIVYLHSVYTGPGLAGGRWTIPEDATRSGRLLFPLSPPSQAKGPSEKGGRKGQKKCSEKSPPLAGLQFIGFSALRQ